MKILILQDYLRSGGTERQSLLLSRAFAADHDVTLLTFRPGGPLAPTDETAFEYRSLQPVDLRMDWFAPRLQSTVQRLRPDIALCMGRMANCYAGGLQTLLHERSPRSAVIATMRTGKPLPWLFERSLQRVAHIIANSREAAQTLVAAHGVTADRISVIHNSLVFSSSATRSDAFRARFGATPSTTVLLCVAMFRPEKNQRQLIEIAAQLPPDFDWQLWLVGDGPARAECERLVLRKKLEARVKFLGFQRDPSAFYTNGDIAVHASASESLSNFLIEAQAQGLPAVAYAAQGIAECFVPGETGYVVPRGEPQVFAQRVQTLAAATPTERAARAAKARRYARCTFDPERQVAAYTDLFHKLTVFATP